MSITAVVENNAIKLPPGVHMPDGTEVEIVVRKDIPAKPEPVGTLSWMLEYAGTIEGPEDLAAEHDHYIHVIPKRGGQ